MADKQSLAQVGVALTPSNVTTAGTTTAGTVKIQWDDADSSSTVFDLIEKARAQILNYYATR